MRTAYKALIAGALGAVVLTLLIISILGSTQYLSVSDLYKKNLVGRDVVVMGKVVNGTIAYRDGYVEFVIFDENSTGRESVRVVYVGTSNINVYDGAIVVAKGSFNGTAIIATEVLTKCPSAYKPAEPEEK